MPRLPRRKQCRDVLKLSDADTIRFLELYREETLLYDITMDEYRQRDLRAAAAKRVASALNIVGFGSVEVLTKFKNLRNAYSQELKKIVDCKKSGGSIHNIYIPKVHWFSTMNSFIRQFIYKRPTLTNIVVPSKNKEIVERPTDSPIQVESSIKVEVETDEEITSNTQQHTAETAFNSNQQTSDGGKRKEVSENDLRGANLKKRNTSSDDNISTAIAKLQEITETARLMASRQQQDMYGHFGNYIASLLRTVGFPRALKIQQDISNLVLAEIAQTYDSRSVNSSASTTTSPAFASSEATDVYSPGYNDEQDCAWLANSSDKDNDTQP